MAKEFDRFQVQQKDQLSVVQLSRPDRATGEQLRDELVEFSRQQETSQILLDFSDVDRHITDTLAGLLEAHGLVDHPERITCCNLPTTADMAVRFLNLDNVFEIYETQHEACREIPATE